MLADVMQAGKLGALLESPAVTTLAWLHLLCLDYWQARSLPCFLLIVMDFHMLKIKNKISRVKFFTHAGSFVPYGCVWTRVFIVVAAARQMA